jgi:hypothetical protein
MSAWWTGIAPAAAAVECGGHLHTMRWQAGALTAVNHGDPEDEATLAALAGESFPCLELLRAWARRRDDPRVLTLASRGPADPLDVNLDQLRLPRGPSRRRTETELLELLALGGGLPDRLQANTAATWTRRLHTGHATLHSTLPQLHAALYGRALTTLRTWLGEPKLAIQLTMTETINDRPLVRTRDGIAIGLPFSWLSDVWARGLAVTFGQLCVAAETIDGTGWTLHTIGPDLGNLAQITIATSYLPAGGPTAPGAEPPLAVTCQPCHLPALSLASLSHASPEGSRHNRH